MKFAKLLSILLICAALPMPVYAEESPFDVVSQDNTETAAETEIVEERSEYFDIAEALSLIPENVAPSKYVTRGDCARLVSRVVYGKTDEGADSGFSDVASDNAVSGAVSIANQWKIMIGYGDGTFKPEQDINKAEFLKTMVTLIGYTVYANGKTNSGETYEQIAASAGITKGVKFESDEHVTYAECARALYNMFKINIISKSLSDDIGNMELTDDTILDLMNIKKIEGIVNKNSYTSLFDANSVNDGRAVIGDTKVIEGKSGIYDMLGYNVQAYIDESDEDDDAVVLYVKPWKMDIEEIDLRDVNTAVNVFTENTLRYDKKNKREKANMDTVFSVIYNGVYSSIRDMSLFENGSGKVTLIDNNNDRKYDIISIEKAFDYVVDSVSTAGNKITVVDKYNKKFEVDTGDSNWTVKTVNESGSSTELRDVSEWSVLSMYDSNTSASVAEKRITKIVVSTSSVSGTANKVDFNDEKTVLIDETEYYISPCYVTGGKVKELSVGNKGTFLLNHLGEICGYKVDTMEKLSEQYGILTKITVDEDSEVITYKIFTQDDEFIKVIAAERVRIDGTTQKKENRYASLVDGNNKAIRQVVKYKLNENGELCILKTAQPRMSSDSDCFKIMRDISEAKIKWRSGLQCFGNIYNISSNTVKFSIPSDETAEEEYSTKISLEENKEYQIGAYVEENPFELSVLLIKDAKSSQITTTDLYIVKKVRTICNEDNELMYEFDVLGVGGEKTLAAETTVSGISDLKKGDVFAYATNGKGNIARIQMIYDYSRDAYLYRDYGFASDYRVVYGKAYDKYNNFFSVAVDEITPETKTQILQSWNAELYTKNIFVYDVENDEIRTGSAEDLKPYKIYSGTCSTVLIADKTAWAKAIVIINR